MQEAAKRLFLASPLGDQFPDLGHKFARNIHHRLGWLNPSLILRQSILLGLLLVMREHSSHLRFIPIGWKLVFAHCCLVLSCRTLCDPALT